MITAYDDRRLTAPAAPVDLPLARVVDAMPATVAVAGDTCGCGHSWEHHKRAKFSLPGRRWCPQCQQLCTV